MAAVDPQKLLADYLKERKALIVDSGSSRQSIRRLLSQSGMKNLNINTAETFEEAADFIRALQPQIIFTEYEVSKKNSLELFKLQKEMIASRLQIIFVVISDTNSDTIASQIAEEDADGLIIRPFTFADLQKKFLDLVTSRMNPEHSAQVLDDVRILAREGKHEAALKAIVEAQRNGPSPNLCCEEAAIHLKLADPDKAVRSLQTGLQTQPTHFKSLSTLLELYLEKQDHAKAYEVARLLTEHYPVTPKRIPTLVRLSVINGKFEDVLNYYEVFSKLEFTDAQICTYVSAGLVICGKYLLRRGNTVEAVAALKKAQVVCRGKASVLREILMTLVNAGLKADAETVMQTMPSDFKNAPEFHLLEFQYHDLVHPAGQVLQLGLDLMKKNIKDATLYEIVIRRSIELKRKPEVIRALVAEAASLYPEQKARFNGAS